MRPFATLADIRRRAAEAVIAQSGLSNAALVRQLRKMFTSDDPRQGALLQQPVIEGAHPFVTAEVNLAGVAPTVLHPEFIKALDALPEKNDYRFPKTRKPFRHQLRAWEVLAHPGAPQSVLVTSGTGSGKTECFLFPILSGLVAQSEKSAAPLEGVQAIMLYPLNALIESQRERLSAWTRPFGGRVRYCLYNGNLPESQPDALRRASAEEQIDRQQLRSSPPPVLVTNITMLEYMLARAEDQPIIEKSKGKLRWIVLDEAHSLVGAAAAEIALLLRRVLIAFDTKPEEVHFVATSATIGNGSDVHKQLQRFLADVAGIADANVHVIEGHRQLPGRPAQRAIMSGVSWSALSPAATYEQLAGDDRIWNFVSERLFTKAQSLEEFERTGRAIGLDAEGFLAALSRAERPHPKTGETERLAPMRIHGFERAVPGVWSCVNPNCPEAPEQWPFGRVLLDRCDVCATCDAPVFEIISCVECGEPFLEAEEDLANDTLRPSGRSLERDEFEFEASRDVDSQEDEDELDERAVGVSLRRRVLLSAVGGPVFRNIHVSKKDWAVRPAAGIETTSLPFAEKLESCPCCQANASRGIDNLLRPLRFGAPFMIANAAPILLEGVDAASHDTRNSAPSSGRRLLSFTDSRQGTARMSAKIQAEAERNFVRSFVYHAVQQSVSQGERADPAAINDELKQLEEAYRKTPLPMIKTMLDNKRRDLAMSAQPDVRGIDWTDMVERLARRPEVEQWVKEVWEPRDPELFYDSNKLAEFLLLREFARRPRKALSLETLGFARLRFSVIEGLAAPPPAFVRHGKSADDWRDFLYATLTFFIRANAAVGIQSGLMHWINPKARIRSLLGPQHNAGDDKHYLVWPTTPKNGAMSSPQVMLVNGLGLDIGDSEHRADIADCLDRAWQQLQPILGNDPERRALDFRKANVAPITEAFLCPITRRVLDIGPFGISPLVRGKRQGRPRQTERVEMPQHPIPILGQVDVESAKAQIRSWLESDQRVATLRDLGIWNSISDRVSLFADYARSAEHSAQQESILLRRYEAQFKKGEINILNCSTTMEMGVDIGTVSTVMMTNVPPSIASYRQRVGRAGRRNQPYSLAFTFCRDRPLDRETFASPLRYLDRSVAAPKVALNSRPIVQRHVNAYLLRRFMLDRGGNSLRMTIGAMMGCPATVGDKRPTLDMRPVAMFSDWLSSPTTSTVVVSDIENLVRHSVLENETTLVDTCRQAIEELEENFVSEWQGLQALAKDEGIKDAGRSRMGVELKRLCEEFLLSALADRGFLPGHGFPTGVVTFLPHKAKIGIPADGKRQTRLSGPQRSLDLAIRDYAPGSEIVLDGLVHRSAGVLLNWKRPASEENIREVQSLKFHWSCRKCGSSDSAREPVTDCSFCGSSVLSQQYLRPSGFAVDGRERPHAETDTISYVAPEEPAVSAKESPWISLPIPELGRFRSTREGSVYYSNRGPNKNGYALCLHCGRAAPDHATLPEAGPDKELPSPLEFHKPLRWKKGENTTLCEGNDNAWKVRRNLELGYEITTDVFELQPAHQLPKAAATALVIAIREAVARILGVEADEMGYSTHGSEGPLGQRCLSLLVYDRSAGGAGFSASIGERIAAVLKDARSILDCPNSGCVTGCASCILTSDAPFEEGSLDRTAALEFLRDHLSFSDGLLEQDRFSPDTTLSVSVPDEIDRALRAAIKPMLRLYLPEDFDPAALATWPMMTHLERWRFLGYDLVFVVPEPLLRRLDSAAMLALYAFGQHFAKTGADFPLHSGQRPECRNGSVIAVTISSSAETLAWGSRDLTAWLPGTSWGQPVENPIARGHLAQVTESAPIAAASLVPRPSSKFDKITNELDRPLTLFGSAMASRIRGLMADLGTAKDAQVVSITYSDPYVRSPLTGKLFIDTAAALMSNMAGQRRVELATGEPDPDRPYPSRLHNDWRDGVSLTKVLQEYATLKKLALNVKLGRVPHGRYMRLQFASGEAITVVFDQGFGPWHLTSSGNMTLHDFRASTTSQANAMMRTSGRLAKSGVGPTYLVAAKERD